MGHHVCTVIFDFVLTTHSEQQFDWFFSSEWGKLRRPEFCFLPSLQMFSHFWVFLWMVGELQSIQGKNSVSCMLTRLLRAQTDGQLSNSCSSSLFLAVASENLVVTASSFKNVICWATWKAPLPVTQSESVSVLKLSLEMVPDLFVGITH